MIPLSVPNLTGNEKKYLCECVDSTFVSSVGQFVSRFEEMVAGISQASFAVATSAGTTALHTALMSVVVGRLERQRIRLYSESDSEVAIRPEGAVHVQGQLP